MANIWRDEALVIQFLEENALKGKEHSVLQKTLYYAYRDWLPEKDYLLASEEFKRRISAYGIQQHGKLWIGLSLKLA